MNKKIIIILVVIILVVITGYALKHLVTELTTQTNTNITENEALSEHEEHEENMDEDDEHDHSVEIEGSEMKNLTIKEVADLWDIDAKILLSEIIAEFDLKNNYTVNTVLEEIRDAEYKFSPAIIKDIAEKIKNSQIN